MLVHEHEYMYVNTKSLQHFDTGKDFFNILNKAHSAKVVDTQKLQ